MHKISSINSTINIQISIKIKYLESPDSHYLQKYFYIWNIALNYYFICKINIRVYFISWKYPYFAYVIILPTLKICTWLKKLCDYITNHKYLSCGKITYFRLLAGDKEISNRRIYFIWKLNEYTNDHRPDAPTIYKF